ncbi:hypothetical protein XENTR_v10012308 [Xenopus tropicalis]|uniref:Chloride channel CLIC-like protein 1 n=1 Tax=Xenopus tropicalis TaxID=8364 RepID=A0A6I8RT26_XENTR|nr:uncharacterized protein LOC100487926 [Xenopus tropicalis]KAE8611023.1 hypothetical protein XENTR_v10012308 [Xenopus tropicalis]
MHLAWIVLLLSLYLSGVTADGQDNEWVDPSDMLFYDAATKKMRIPKKLIESNTILKQHFKGILHHAKQLSLPNSHQDEEQHYDAEIILTRQMITEMNKIINDEDWNPMMIETFLQNIVFRMKYHDKYNWEMRFKDIFFMDVENAFMVVLFILTVIGLIDLWIQMPWIGQFTCVLFLLAYVLQWFFDYEIVFTIKKKELEQQDTKSINLLFILTIGALLMLCVPWFVWFVKTQRFQQHFPRGGEGNGAELHRNEEHIPMGGEGNGVEVPGDPTVRLEESITCLSVEETNIQTFHQSDVQEAKPKATKHSVSSNSDHKNTTLYCKDTKYDRKPLKGKKTISTLTPKTEDESHFPPDASLPANTQDNISFQELLDEGVDQSVQNRDRSLLDSNESTSSGTPQSESLSFVPFPEPAQRVEASHCDDGPSVSFVLL